MLSCYFQSQAALHRASWVHCAPSALVAPKEIVTQVTVPLWSETWVSCSSWYYLSYDLPTNTSILIYWRVVTYCCVKYNVRLFRWQYFTPAHESKTEWCSNQWKGKWTIPIYWHLETWNMRLSDCLQGFFLKSRDSYSSINNAYNLLYIIWPWGEIQVCCWIFILIRMDCYKSDTMIN